MKLYLCGPVTGMADGNKAEFSKCQLALESLGIEVVNPTDLGMTIETPWGEAMKKCITEMLTCDGVAMLPSWTGQSRGCRLEVTIATKVGIEVGYCSDWIAHLKGEPVSKASMFFRAKGYHGAIF